MTDHYAIEAVKLDLEPPSGFADALFSRSAKEDLVQYAPDLRAAMAVEAWAFLNRPRTPGKINLRLYDPDDRRLSRIMILEVVNDDMPFLLDSALADIEQAGLELRLVAHPIFAVGRDDQGRIGGFSLDLSQPGAAPAHESLLHIHLGRVLDEERRAALLASLEVTFGEVRRAVRDRTPMLERVAEAVVALRAEPPAFEADEIAEAIHFLEWMLEDNFVFLGERLYSFRDSGGKEEAQPAFEAVGGSGLGILEDPEVKVLRRGRELVVATPEVIEFMRDRHVLIVAKANVKSRVHRRAYMDYVGLKRFDDEGRCVGELRIVGLFTAAAYTQPTHAIPYVRHKAARVLERLRLDPLSHSGRVLAAALETYPRDELFQIDVATLARFSVEIAALQDRPRLRVLTRIDRFDRFASVLVFVPRDRFDTRAQHRLGEALARIYEGRVSATYPSFPEGPLVRIHYIIGRDGGRTPDPAQEAVESALALVIRTWSDHLRSRLIDTRGQAGFELGARWGDAFSAGYMEAFSPSDALQDIAVAQRLTRERPFAVSLRASRGGGESLDFEVFSRERPIPLSNRAPIIEAMGFRIVSERTFEIKELGGEATIWLHDMALAEPLANAAEFAVKGPLLESAAMAVLVGEAESDGYNALVWAAGLNWREVAVLRTLSRYLRQVGVNWSQSYMWQTLVRNAGVASQLIELFTVRFDPDLSLRDEEREDRAGRVVAEIEALLQKVESLDEDRIIRRFLNLVQVAVRTNFFQPAGEEGAAVAIKFSSRKIEDLPPPRPLYEVFVYSPRVEGVHMRFGHVARGGLRWSDRPQDFRTEILGLVKAQQVKNAVIVPVGAKGGFVAKKAPPPAQRDAFLAEGIAAYKLFVRSLLDITDNLVDGAVRPPHGVIRRDDDDPYLVVAADKGTATFSDIANSLAIDHGFWLGDAFASGGSAGYDHKKIGITARGAWEAVKRHFREMDVDIQTIPFTVAGVGDMSGDVFGNGMLLSAAIKLVAAFDHRDIFIDPSPDPEVSFVERKRLFALSRSSWRDYRREAISAGGGVFSRSEKSIPLSPQMRSLLGLERDAAAPDEILAAILKAPVDLLWFGGIGTYVRSEEESNFEVGDRANDAFRIRASQLRCKVIGEGANLGLTQRARVEAARLGVRLNTDAIDNSAGVNTSDVEVNIKIALSGPLASGSLTREARDRLLEEMTDEVASLVLRNNYQQTLSISLAERRGAADVGFAVSEMQRLESQGRLERTVEFLPTDEELRARERSGTGLSRPEISVLLAYAKLSLHDELLASDLPDDPYLSAELRRYFPAALRARFPQTIDNHRLRREIVATQLANSIINRTGPTALARFFEEARARPTDVARAFAVVRDVFALGEVYGQIDALDGRIPGIAQLRLYERIRDLLQTKMVWFIRNVDMNVGLGAVAARFRSAIEAMPLDAPCLASSVQKDAQALCSGGAPADLAERLASLQIASSGCDLVLIAERSGRSVRDCAGAFFEIDDLLKISQLARSVRELGSHDHFERMALDRSAETIEDALRRLTLAALREPLAAPGDSVSAWRSVNSARIERARAALAALSKGGLTLAKSIVAGSILAELS